VPAGTVSQVRRAEACTRGLAADDDRVRAMTERPPEGWRVVERYVLLPSARRPQILAPLAAPAAGAAGVRQFASGAPARERAAAALVAAGLRAGAIQRLALGRATVAVTPGTTSADLAELVLSRHLAGALQLPHVDLTVRVAAARPNGKPVMQVSAPRGGTVAYVKIGWNDLTRPLVAGEAAALGRLASAPPRSFDTPRLMYAGDWRGYAVTAVAPVVGGRMRVSPEPPPAASRELALGSKAHRARLAESGWWLGLRGRIDAVGGDPQRAQADRVAAAFGDREMAFGRAHGDWTPWNMAEVDGRLAVWDWERAAGAVPVGIDALHYTLLVALNARGLDPPRAVADTLRRAARILPSLDVPAGDAAALMSLELLEMSVRFAEARGAGVAGLNDRFGAALAELLD
jgi:hypothetical protein